MQAHVWQNRWGAWFIANRASKFMPIALPAAEHLGAHFQYVESRRTWLPAWRTADDAVSALVNMCPDLVADRIERRPFKARRVSTLPQVDVPVERPEAFKHETKDCTVRALELATGASYADAHEIMRTRAGRKDGDGAYPERAFGMPPAYWRFHAEPGAPLPAEYRPAVVLGHSFEWVDNRQPRAVAGARVRWSSIYVTAGEFVRRNPVGAFYVCRPGHAFVIVDGEVFDTGRRVSVRTRITDAWRVRRVIVDGKPLPATIGA